MLYFLSDINAASGKGHRSFAALIRSNARTYSCNYKPSVTFLQPRFDGLRVPVEERGPSVLRLCRKAQQLPISSPKRFPVRQSVRCRVLPSAPDVVEPATIARRYQWQFSCHSTSIVRSVKCCSHSYNNYEVLTLLVRTLTKRGLDLKSEKASRIANPRTAVACDRHFGLQITGST